MDVGTILVFGYISLICYQSNFVFDHVRGSVFPDAFYVSPDFKFFKDTVSPDSDKRQVVIGFELRYKL